MTEQIKACLCVNLAPSQGNTDHGRAEVGLETWAWPGKSGIACF